MSEDDTKLVDHHIKDMISIRDQAYAEAKSSGTDGYRNPSYALPDLFQYILKHGLKRRGYLAACFVVAELPDILDCSGGGVLPRGLIPETLQRALNYVFREYVSSAGNRFGFIVGTKKMEGTDRVSRKLIAEGYTSRLTVDFVRFRDGISIDLKDQLDFLAGARLVTTPAKSNVIQRVKPGIVRLDVESGKKINDLLIDYEVGQGQELVLSVVEEFGAAIETQIPSSVRKAQDVILEQLVLARAESGDAYTRIGFG